MAQQPPLLSGEGQMTPAKRASLAILVQQPGFAVIQEMLEDACKRSVENVIKLDPTSEDHERKLKVLQGLAYERNQFSALLLKSIDWHIQAERQQVQDSNIEPPENPILKGRLKNE